MKNLLLTMFIIAAAGTATLGQRQSTGRVGGNSSQSASGSASATAAGNSGNLSLAEGTVLQGELQKTLDVKSARPGDQVLLKTTRDIKQNGRTVVSKGSTLLGRVTEVAQRSKQNNQSRLGVLFERVQGHGIDMPITASIVSITQAAGSASVADLGDMDVMGSSRASGSGSVSRSGGSGGLLGGVGNTVAGLGNTAGGVTDGVTNTAGGVVNTTRGAVGGVANGIGSTAGGVTRSVNGISILNSGSTNASAGNGSILASSDRNVRVEKGSMINLQLSSSTSASASRSH